MDGARAPGRTRAVLPFGSSAFLGSLSKGDIDLLVRIEGAERDALLHALDTRASRAQPENWTDSFASYAFATSSEPSIGLQVVVSGSPDDRALSAQQAALGSLSLRAAYDRAKTHGAPLGRKGYWRVKDAFWRCHGKPGPTWTEARRPVFKILLEPEWQALLESGATYGAAVALKWIFKGAATTVHPRRHRSTSVLT